MNLILSRSIRLSTKYCTKSIYYSLSTQLTPTTTSPPTTSPHSSPATIESLSLFISQSQGSSQATTTYTLPKKFLDALKEYHNFYEHTLVPSYFVIPSKYPWPQELWGYPLGSEVKLIRRLKTKYKFEGTELKKYDTKVTAKHKTQLLMRAFRLYKEIYGNIQIKTEYVIKNDDARWPAEMIGLELGMKLRLVVYNGYYKDLHKELDQMGVAWSSVELRHDKFLLALKTYKSIYGNLYCSKAFSIPTGEKARKWPKELHGWKLGKVLDNIRAGLVSIDRVRAEVDKLGFVWDMREYQWKIVQNMLLTFKQVIFAWTSIILYNSHFINVAIWPHGSS
jgi:hypothetical protein